MTKVWARRGESHTTAHAIRPFGRAELWQAPCGLILSPPILQADLSASPKCRRCEKQADAWFAGSCSAKNQRQCESGDRPSKGERALFASIQAAGLDPVRRHVISSKRLPPRPRCHSGETVPDAVLLTQRVAVYYDGCYWHECPEHCPGSRGGARAAADQRINDALSKDGWTVIRIWEHDDLDAAVARVIDAARPARGWTA